MALRAGGTLRAGELVHRIVIQERTDTRDAFGEPDPTWSTFATRWARVSAVSGTERFGAESLDTEITHEVRLRYVADVTGDMRITHDGRTLEIQSIERGDRKADLLLLCKELVD